MGSLDDMGLPREDHVSGLCRGRACLGRDGGSGGSSVEPGDPGQEIGIAGGKSLDPLLKSLGLRAKGAVVDLCELLCLTGSDVGLASEEVNLAEHINPDTAGKDHQGAQADLEGQAQGLDFALGRGGIAEGRGRVRSVEGVHA